MYFDEQMRELSNELADEAEEGNISEKLRTAKKVSLAKWFNIKKQILATDHNVKRLYHISDILNQPQFYSGFCEEYRGCFRCPLGQDSKGNPEDPDCVPRCCKEFYAVQDAVNAMIEKVKQVDEETK